MSYRTHMLVYLEDLSGRIRDADALAGSHDNVSISQSVLRECYSEIYSTARSLRMKIENWVPENSPTSLADPTLGISSPNHGQHLRRPVQKSEPPTQVIYHPPTQSRRGRGVDHGATRSAPRCGARRDIKTKKNQASGPTGPPLCLLDGCQRACHFYPADDNFKGEYDTTCCMALPPHVSVSSLILSQPQGTHLSHSGCWNIPIDPRYKGPICYIKGCKYPCFLDLDLGKYRNTCGPKHLRLVDSHQSTAPHLLARPPLDYQEGYCMLEGCFRPAVVFPATPKGGHSVTCTPCYMTYRGHCCVDHQILHRQMAERMAMLVAGRDGNHTGRPIGWTEVLKAS